MDGGEVDTGYFGAWVLIGHISVSPEIEIVSHSFDDMLLNSEGLVNAHGPYSRSGADVKDFLGRETMVKISCRTFYLAIMRSTVPEDCSKEPSAVAHRGSSNTYDAQHPAVHWRFHRSDPGRDQSE